MKLSFQEYGAGNAIALLHAFPLSSWMWSKQIEPIINAGWRVILPDFPGFGESSIGADISRMENLAEDVSRLLSTLNIGQAVIGGLSMGGYVALDFVRMFPEKTSALILADTTAASDSEEKRESRFSLIEKIKEKSTAVLIDEMLPNVISEYTKSNNTELVITLKNEFKKATKDGVIAASRGMAERKDNTDFLKNIKAPTLLIFGEKDKVTTLDAAETLHRKIVNSALVTIPNAGHYSNMEQPEIFNDVLIDFLKKIK